MTSHRVCRATSIELVSSCQDSDTGGLLTFIPGRTGRMGREGKAVTFFTNDDGPFLKTYVPVPFRVPGLTCYPQHRQRHPPIRLIGAGLDLQVAKAVQDDAQRNGQSQATRLCAGRTPDRTGGCNQEAVCHIAWYFPSHSAHSGYVQGHDCWLKAQKGEREGTFEHIHERIP